MDPFKSVTQVLFVCFYRKICFNAVYMHRIPHRTEIFFIVLIVSIAVVAMVKSEWNAFTSKITSLGILEFP